MPRAFNYSSTHHRPLIPRITLNPFFVILSPLFVPILMIGTSAFLLWAVHAIWVLVFKGTPFNYSFSDVLIGAVLVGIAGILNRLRDLAFGLDDFHYDVYLKD